MSASTHPSVGESAASLGSVWLPSVAVPSNPPSRTGREPSIPTVQSDCISTYVEQFSQDDLLQFATGRNLTGKLATQLPLLRVPLPKIVRWMESHRNSLPGNPIWNVFELPNNPWAQTGDLIVDAETMDAHSMPHLVESLRQEPACLLKLDWVYESAHWKNFVQELEKAGAQVFREKQFDVGIIDVSGDWNTYVESLGKAHRKSIRRSTRKLQQIGEIQLERLTRFSSREELEIALRQAFEISHRGWKGQQGTSVLSQRGMFEFYLDIAWNLSQENQFELQFLRVGDQRVAFEYGYRDDGIYYSHKVGYDVDYAKYSPGQLLMFLQLEHFFMGDEITLIDTIGVVSDATRKWKPRLQPRYRYLIGTRGLPREWVRVLKSWKPRLKRWMRRDVPE